MVRLLTCGCMCTHHASPSDGRIVHLPTPDTLTQLICRAPHVTVCMFNGVLQDPGQCEQSLADTYPFLFLLDHRRLTRLTRSRGRSRYLSLLLIPSCCVCCPCGAVLPNCLSCCCTSAIGHYRPQYLQKIGGQ